MFRIRQIFDDSIPVNKTAIAQVQAILRVRIPGLREDEIASIPERLKNPLKHRFRSILFVAEGSKGSIEGFAFLLHEPDLDFAFLDYLSTARQLSGRGLGGALYERTRFHAVESGCRGLFFECLPDDPRLSPDPGILKQNITRLKFYERYGARPVAGTAYETPLRQGMTTRPIWSSIPWDGKEPFPSPMPGKSSGPSWSGNTETSVRRATLKKWLRPSRMTPSVFVRPDMSARYRSPYPGPSPTIGKSSSS